MRLESPAFLLAAAAVPLLIWLTLRGGAVSSLSPPRRRAFLVLRSAAVLLLALALAGPAIPLGRAGLTLVFMLDQSASVGEAARARAVRAFEEVRSRLAPGDRAELVRFGGSAETEELAAGRALEAEGAAEVDRSATDLAGALQLALAGASGAGQRRILLASDGNETRGRAADAAAIAGSLGVPVYALPLAPAVDEAAVEDIIAPQRVRAGEPFDVTVMVWASGRVPVRVSILRDGAPLGGQQKLPPPGRSAITVQGLLDEPGPHRFEAVAEAAGDQVPENNRFAATVEATGSPAILYVSPRGERSPAFLAALRAQGMSARMSGPAGLPGSLRGLLAYDAVVLDGVPAYSLSYEKMGLLERYVRDAGGGLLMIGGPGSFGAGGYYKTPVERALPVDMDVKAQVRLPRLSLVIAADKSGSMGAAGPSGETKLDLVKSAAASTVELLNPFDQVGLLAFDADWQWTVPLTEAGDRDRITRELSTLSSGGGTLLYPALQEAHRVLAASPSALRHLIVLTDGLSQPADFRREVQGMARDRITVSAVAVGEDADTGLLSRIASWGGGRAYLARDPSSIPRIFMTEALLVSRGLLIEKRFIPRPASAGEVLRGIPLGAMPALDGFVLTYLKNGAEESLGALYDAPLLATWRYGLGRSAAFTSDLTGGWGAAWLAWDGFPRFAAQLARWIQRPAPSGVLHPSLRVSAGAADLTVDAYDELGVFADALDVRARVIQDGGEPREVPLSQRGPGLYAAQFPAAETAELTATVWAAGRPDVGQRILTAGGTYPEEYRVRPADLHLLREIARATGGKLLSLAGGRETDWQEITRRGADQPAARVPLWPYFLAAAFAAFLFDVAARRLQMPQAVSALLRRRRRARAGPGYAELAGMVNAARLKAGGGLRERISESAQEGRLDPELAAHLYIARLKGRRGTG